MKILPLAVCPRRVLLIGAGQVAARKMRVLRQSDCVIDIVAREIRDDFFRDLPVQQLTFRLAWLEMRQERASDGPPRAGTHPFGGQRVEDERGSHQSPDDAYDIVINATGDETLSKQLWENRRRLRYWLNSVDTPQYCDFYFGAQVRDHDLCVSVSSGGASPAYAQKVRDLIAACLPRHRQAFYDDMRHRRAEERQAETGKVFLIGCGPGSVDNLTFKAFKTLKFLDVALIDALVGHEIVDLLPADCLQIDVSKQKGHQHYAQEDINAMMLHYAQEGLQVGRLKSGDPAIFGRLFEEASTLLAHGVELEIINGVSTALAGCLAGGIAPTLRDCAAGALIVSAHLRESRFNDDWIDLLKDFPYTVIVLMAWSFAGKIRETARARGISMTLPAAFVSRIDRADQITILGSLGELEEMAKRCEKPAILVIGNTVAKAEEMPFSGVRRHVNQESEDSEQQFEAAKPPRVLISDP
jgi:uroporphyrin-III C-methyltransferase/precorrin-2 dehydrogenase/sirohydrochlorin ferrochelatase